MTAPDLTLKNVQKEARSITRVYRVSDFLSKEQTIAMKTAQEERIAAKKRGFDAIDALSGEILGRFGYHAWMAWQNGQIRADKMLKMVLAERARTKRELLGLEGIIMATGAGANNPTKGGHMPKSLKNAIKIFQSEQKQAKGVING